MVEPISATLTGIALARQGLELLKSTKEGMSDAQQIGQALMSVFEGYRQFNEKRYSKSAISKLFKTYKYKNSVASKGDNARTHTGVIAQQVRTALETEGLDCTKYSFWCSDTWWEKEIEVPAVEAADAVTETQKDDRGRDFEVVVKEAVEAQDAYTYVEQYYNSNDAPEGATEVTRLGIRYPELLAFIGAATEQRLTSIEARLTALEG